MDQTDRRSTAFIWLFLGTLLFGGAAAELGVRFHRAYSPAPTGFSTTDSPLNDAPVGHGVAGPYRPNRITTWRKFGTAHEELATVQFRTNNLGWVSHFDYGAKQPGEFRVAVLGNSLTASITNPTPWTDVAQRELLASPQTRHIKIINLGIAAAGYGSIAAYQAPTAEKLGADLVILNITFASLDLPNVSSGSADNRILVGSVEVPLQCSTDGDNCLTSAMLRVPAGYMATPNDLDAVARTLSRRETLKRALSRNASLFFPSHPGDDTRDLEAEALLHIRTMAQRHRRFMVILNPLTWLTTKDRLPEALIAEGIDFVDLTPALPEASAEEQATWYNIPGDRHWSDKGAEIYGRLVADVIRRRAPPVQIKPSAGVSE